MNSVEILLFTEQCSPSTDVDTRRDCQFRIEAMLLGLPGNQISFDRFTLAYEKSCGGKLPGQTKLVSFLDDMPDILKVKLINYV